MFIKKFRLLSEKGRKSYEQKTDNFLYVITSYINYFYKYVNKLYCIQSKSHLQQLQKIFSSMMKIGPLMIMLRKTLIT